MRRLRHRQLADALSPDPTNGSLKPVPSHPRGDPATISATGSMPPDRPVQRLRQGQQFTGAGFSTFRGGS